MFQISVYDGVGGANRHGNQTQRWTRSGSVWDYRTPEDEKVRCLKVLQKRVNHGIVSGCAHDRSTTQLSYHIRIRVKMSQAAQWDDLFGSYGSGHFHPFGRPKLRHAPFVLLPVHGHAK